MGDRTILLVEDEHLLRKTTARYLAAKGYEILQAENGEEGLKVFRDCSPDLVITDLRMPIMDGMQFMKHIVAEVPDVPIIIFSGMGKMVDVIDALRAGAWDYITKPVENMEVLEHCIERALERATFIKNEKDQRTFLEAEVEERTKSLAEKNNLLLEEMHQRKIQEEKVLQAKNEWERTVDAMPDMIAIISRDHRIVRVNETLLKRIGSTYEELHGQKCYVCMHGCERPVEFCPHRQMMEDGVERRVEMFEEKLGGYCEIIVSPYHDQNGNLAGSVHIIRDINARRRSEKERERLLSQLLHAQKLESVGQLASGIAHEINTPTQFIGTNIAFLKEAFEEIAATINELGEIISKEEGGVAEKVQSLLDELEWYDLEEEITDAIKQSADGTGRIGSIVKAMKEFSHPGNKSREFYNINKLIETTTTVARNEWKYVSTVEMNLDSNIPEIPCYPDELGQVLLNMIVNSAHAIAEKLGENPTGNKGVIKIETYHDSQYVTVSISDTGNGIPEKIQNRVFDPFFTTKEVGRGTGQGLAISHDVITEKHGGTIKLKSEKGEGTTFWVKLPIFRDDMVK